MSLFDHFQRVSETSAGSVRNARGGTVTGYAELWRMSLAARAALAGTPAGAVRPVVSATPRRLADVMGALLAGRDVVLAEGTRPVPAGWLLQGLGALVDAVKLTPDDTVGVPLNPGQGNGFGLVNGMLAAWFAGAGQVLLDAEALADPLAWPRTCARHKVTYTPVDDALLARAAAALHTADEDIDLSTLRVVLVRGVAGVIEPDTLRAFNDSAMEFSFDEVALCPASTVDGALVTAVVPPDVLWRCRVVSEPALRDGDWRELLTDGLEVLSYGRPLPAVELSASGPAVRPLRVRLAGAGTEWRPTGQHGCVVYDELHVVPGARP